MPRFAYLDEAYGESRRQWISALEAGVKKGVFRADLEPDLFERFISTPLWTTALWLGVTPHSLEAVEEQFIAFVMHGVCTDEPPRSR